MRILGTLAFLFTSSLLTTGCVLISVAGIAGFGALAPKHDQFKNSVIYENHAISKSTSNMVFIRSNSIYQGEAAIVLFGNGKKLAAISRGRVLRFNIESGAYHFSIKYTYKINSSCLESFNCMKQYSGKNVGELPPEKTWLESDFNPIKSDLKPGETYFIYADPEIKLVNKEFVDALDKKV